MKRSLSMILIFALLLTIAVPAQAAETINVTLSADKETVAPGETVTLTLSIDKALSNMFCFEYWVYYNAELLELTGTTAGEATSLTDFGNPVADKNGTHFNVFALNKEGTPWDLKAGTIATITFTAKADASGDAAFNLVQEVGLVDYDTYEETPANLVNNAANVTVKAAEPEVPADPNTVTLEGNADIGSIVFSGVTVKESQVTTSTNEVIIDVTLDEATDKDATVNVAVNTVAGFLVVAPEEAPGYSTFNNTYYTDPGACNGSAALTNGKGGFLFKAAAMGADDFFYRINFTVAGSDEPDAPAAAGYTVTMPADKTTVTGQTIDIPVTVGHTGEEEVYNAFDFTFTYDPAALELTSTGEEITNVKDEEGNPTGVIHVERYGSDLSVDGTALTLTFKALTAAETEVKLTAAKVGVSETALSQEAADASILVDTTAIEITGYAVNLPTDFDGPSVAYPNEDYTFTAKDKNYNYEIEATINGEEIDVTDNGDGSFTIAKGDITGNIVITYTKEGKTFDVSLGEDMTSEAANAQYMTNYTATLTKEPGYGYQITVTIGGQPYTGFTYDDATGTLTIPGEDITGEIVINSGKTAGEFTVTFNGNGAGAAVGETVAEGGKAYSFTLTKAEGYTYTVTATMGGEPVDLAEEDGTYTIASVTGDIVITIEMTSDLAVVVNEYVTLNDKTVFLVTATQTLAEGKALSYGEGVMFWSNQYNAWAYLVIVDTTLSEEDAKAQIKVVEAAYEILDQTYDVNGAGAVDINDAQLVYDLYNNEYQDFTVASMQKFLKADVNNSKNINVNDAAAIVAEIVKNK